MAGLYVDGSLAASASLLLLLGITNSNPVAVGQDGTLAWAGSHVLPLVDKFRVWGVALLGSEVAALAESCVAYDAAPLYPTK